MPYTIGVSTGLWKIAHQQSPGKSLEFMGLSRKAIWSIYKGVNFAQIDLESTAEFLEDDLDNKMKKIKAMGIDFGVHGEVPETAGKLVPHLDTAEEDVYKRSHDRFIYSAKNCARIGSKYYLLHSSASRSWHELFMHQAPTLMVDIWGRRFKHLLELENSWLLEWAAEKDFVMEVFRGGRNIPDKDDYLESMKAKYNAVNQGKEPSSDELKDLKKKAEKKAIEKVKETIIETMSINDIGWGVERIAFYVIAKWMEDKRSNCPSELRAIWKGIAGGGSIDTDAFREKAENWVPAVAAAYTWGHFNPEKCPTKVPYEDPKKYFEKMWMAFETPMTGAGVEEMARLGEPIHIYQMVKNLKMKNAVVVLDFEHQLASGINPEEQVKALPEGEGKWIKIIHVGYPAVLAPAHIPIPLGSDAQFWIYKILWEYRKKGFKDGIIIFERGGGDEPIQESVLSLKKIVEYLEKEVSPEKLINHEDFFGLKKMGPETIRQRLQIKEHALDPLKGMLMIPEEEYDFLGTSAAAQRKLEEWKKERLK